MKQRHYVSEELDISEITNYLNENHINFTIGIDEYNRIYVQER